MAANNEHDKVFVRFVDKPKEGPRYVKGMAWVPGLLQDIHPAAQVSKLSLAVEVDAYHGWNSDLAPGVVTDAVFLTRQHTITRLDADARILFCERSSADITAIPAVLTGELLSHVGIQRPGEDAISWYKAVGAADAMNTEIAESQTVLEGQQQLAPKSA